MYSLKVRAIYNFILEKSINNKNSKMLVQSRINTNEGTQLLFLVVMNKLNISTENKTKPEEFGTTQKCLLSNNVNVNHSNSVLYKEGDWKISMERDEGKSSCCINYLGKSNHKCKIF